jgi:carbonic anhydrase
MATFDTLIGRNQDFAAHHFPKNLPLMPTLRTMIIGCVDQRVDPAHLLGLQPGEAIVIRNVGGHITPATLQTRECWVGSLRGKEALLRARFT